MNARVLKYILCAMVFGMSACTIFHRPKEGAVVEVEGRYLYRSTLDSLTRGMEPEDSARVAEQYIRQWVCDVLVFQEAHRSASKEVERMVEDYRRSLYVYDYEQRYLLRRMPTQVDDSLVAQFYESHASQFVLNQAIVKGLLLIVPQDAPRQNDLRKWLDNPNEHLEEIEEYAYGNASGYELFLDRFVTANQLLLRLPPTAVNPLAGLSKTHRIEVQDSVSVYILQSVEDYQPGQPMPMEFARPEIEKVLLSQRRIEYLRRHRDDLYREAELFQKIRFYEE